MKTSKRPDPKALAARLTEQFGLPLCGEFGQPDDVYRSIELYPDGVHRNDGFCLRLSLGWRSLAGNFIPGAFAGPMIEQMGKAKDNDKDVFCELIGKIQAEKGTVSMSVNDLEVQASDTATWPNGWNRLTLSFEKSPLAINTEDGADTESTLTRWGGLFLGAILALTPREDNVVEDETNPEGLPEGAVSRIVVNRYERNRFNRAACIEIHGHVCKACGFDFFEVYGEIGERFIHVHHVTPVSQIDENYKINPAVDLIPVCANCHSMLHRRNPPLTVEELKGLIATSNTGYATTA